VEIEGTELVARAVSEARLEFAVDDMEEELGDLIELIDVEVLSPDEVRDAIEDGDSRAEDLVIPPELEQAFVSEYLAERMFCWLDEPHQALDGRTPRDAVDGLLDGEVVRLLRQLENGQERNRRAGEASFDVGPLWKELGLGDDLLAA
jgi:hypothetical protein